MLYGEGIDTVALLDGTNDFHGVAEGKDNQWLDPARIKDVNVERGQTANPRILNEDQGRVAIGRCNRVAQAFLELVGSFRTKPPAGDGSGVVPNAAHSPKRLSINLQKSPRLPRAQRVSHPQR